MIKLGRIVRSVLAVIFALQALVVFPQETMNASNAKNSPGAGRELAKAIPLVTNSNLSDRAEVQAALIPAPVGRRIFGKEVANNYAVVEVIVSNLDPKATMIVQGIFLDYSQWELGGDPSEEAPSRLTGNQRSNVSTQVASVEARLVRGELLDAQPWTFRNWTIRSLVALGSVGAAFQFPFSRDVLQGMNAFNGVAIPAAQTLWPDGAINQINRISDFGFQINKIISPRSSDIMVAFFPIDRFLTPGFREVFLRFPAAWFVPNELMLDPKTSGEFDKVIRPLADTIDPSRKSEPLQKRVVEAYLAQCEKEDLTPTCVLKRLLQGISLSNIHIVLHGVMTIEETQIPPTIYSVDFEGGNKGSIWTTTTAQRGTIRGLYLAGGMPIVVDENRAPVDGVTIKPQPDGSSDTALGFTMTLKKCIPLSSRVFFAVTKPRIKRESSDALRGPLSSDENTMWSTPFEFPVQPQTDCKDTLEHKQNNPEDTKAPRANP